MPDVIDYRQVAQIHIESIDQGYLSTLGEGFLSLMYRSIDECEDAVLLVETDQGRVLGFVSGATGMRPVYRQLLRHFPQLLWSLAPVFVNPQKIWRLLEILCHSSGGSAAIDLPPYELLSIAVSPDSRGSGVAKRLYDQLAQHFADLGAMSFCIVVGEALGPAHRFYVRAGAKLKTEITVHGQEKSAVYIHDLRRNRA